MPSSREDGFLTIIIMRKPKPATRGEEDNIEKSAKKSAIGWSVIFAASLTIILALTTYILNPVIPELYLIYLQVGEVALIGFAASNLIGNIIAGIYLAITRPFRIGDRIKVFDGDGKVSDIGLLYTRLLLDNGDEMLASNSSIVTTNIILRKKEKAKEEGGEGGGY